ncbi:YtcA family lipoprotein [Pararobbsia silviterrae]|uniref:Uncharacterized protein YtcA n=1 Tax=Pararobbsia silviterrae TaxID=1792498 RepID=A0A494XGC3_9BURK|nr:YtcA family lipoprotein [Pararobbsia silviterrae]RKP47134.1 hypothetical protein D7S86_23620 [Pararobbsia silviterrae]
MRVIAIRALAALIGCASLAGCRGAPSIGVLGAYFPDWMFSIVGGVVLVVGLHITLRRRGLGAWLNPPALVYPALTILLSIVVWAVAFNLTLTL